MPTSNDDVYIPRNVNVTVDALNLTCKNLTLNSSTTSNGTATLTFKNSTSLSISNLIIGSNNNRMGSIDMNSGGTLAIGGTVTINYGNSWMPGLGTVIFNGTSNQTLPSSWMTNFNNLMISNNSTKTLGAATTVTKDLTISSGATLSTGTNTLTLNGSLSNSGTLQIGNTLTTTLTTLPGTVEYNGGVQAVKGLTYTNLIITNPGAKTLNGATTVSGALTINSGATLSTSTNALTLNGTFTNTGTLQIGNTLTTTLTTLPGTVEYNGGVQTVKGLTYANLTITNATGVKTLNGATTVSGALTINSGATLSTSTNALTLNGSLSNSGTLQIGNTFTAPSLSTVSGTVEYNGGDQTVKGLTYTNLTITNATGVKTLNGQTTVSGALTINSGATLSTSTNALTLNGSLSNSGTLQIGNTFTAPSLSTVSGTVEYNGGDQTVKGLTYNNLTLSNPGAKTLDGATTVNGNLSVGSGVTLNGGAYTLKLGGSVSGAGDFNASTGTVEYNGAAAQTIAPFTYNNLSLSGGNTKLLNAATTITGDLSIGSSTTFETSNKDLTLSGNLTHGGSFNAGSSAITLSGGNNQSIAGFTTTGNVTVDKTAGKTVTLSGISSFTNLTITSGQLVIPAGSEVTVSGATAITPANGLIIESSPEPAAGGAGTGSFITGSASGTGTASVVRYMTPNRWHLVSSPLSQLQNENIGTFLGANPSIPKNIQTEEPTVPPFERGMRAYDGTISTGWGKFFREDSQEKLITGKGYSIRVKGSTGTQRVTFTGNLQPVTHTVTVTPEVWNCVGNPYTSALNITSSGTSFLSENLAKMPSYFQCVYVYDEASGGYSPINSSTTNQPVQQGQAFMVAMLPGSTSVSFTSAMQTHQVALALKSTEDIWPTINLVATGDSINSSTTIAFHEGMTPGLDPSYDAGLLSAGGPELYTQLVEDYGIPFDIQALPSDQYGQLIIPVGVDYPKGGAVTFSARGMYLPAACRPILEDRLTGIKTDLTDQTYTADLSANTAGVGRFYLHTSWSSTGVDSRENSGQLTAWASGNNEINIKGQINNGAVASLFDLQGRLIATHVMREGVRERFSLPAVKPGIYLLQVRDMQQVQVIKVRFGE